MTDDQVKRYQLDYHHTQTYAEMVEDCDGDWVKYKDYKDAAVRIEELEAKLKAKEKLMLALAGDKIDLVSELAGVKGKLAKAREEGFWVGRSCGGAKKEIDAALAELKGQDDE